jgi:hypothetical protein
MTASIDGAGMDVVFFSIYGVDDAPTELEPMLVEARSAGMEN